MWADPDRLQQIFWNLLSNAVKFTPSGGRVEVTHRSGGTATARRVADTGEGIAPAFLPRVFERFRQADGSSTRRTADWASGSRSSATSPSCTAADGGRERRRRAGLDIHGHVRLRAAPGAAAQGHDRRWGQGSVPKVGS